MRYGLFIKVFLFLIGAFYVIISEPATRSDAQEPLTLQTLLEEARANNPELRSLNERIKAKEARARAEGVLDDPNLKVEMEDLSRNRPLNISPGNAMLTRYTVSQMFPFPGKLSLREKIALKEAMTARAELKAKELEVTTLVKEAYFDYAYFDESVRRNREIKELLADIALIAEAKYSIGQVSQQDVIKAQVEAAMLTNEIITLEAEKGVAAARLKSLINRTQDSPLGEPGGLPKERVEFKTEELINTAVQKNPEIKMTEFEAEANELGVDLAKKNYYPDLMVGAAPIQRDGRFDSFDVMFQVNIPIWRSKYDSRAKEAASNAHSLRLKVLSQKNIKSFEVKGAAVQVEAADRMRVLYETSLLPQVELSFESALKNYRAGKIDFLTLIDTERQLKNTRIEYLKTLLDYRKRVAALEKAVGEDFKATISLNQNEPSLGLKPRGFHNVKNNSAGLMSEGKR